MSRMFARLELNFSISILRMDLTNLGSQTHREFVSLLNNLFSQINSVNESYLELKKLHIIRLYLIGSYKGWCHALGKPVRGQRTWSNAWSSYKYNRTMRQFITEITRQLSKTRKEEKINYRLTKKKYGVGKEKDSVLSKKVSKKANVWF